METEHFLLTLISMSGAVVVATAVATAYLGRQIDQKLPRMDYELKHNDLQEHVEILHRELSNRLRELELWAARQGYHNGHKREGD